MPTGTVFGESFSANAMPTANASNLTRGVVFEPSVFLNP